MSRQQGDRFGVEVGGFQRLSVLFVTFVERGEGLHKAAELHRFERLLSARVDPHCQFIDVVNRIFQSAVFADVGEPNNAGFSVQSNRFGDFFVIGLTDFGKNRIVAGPAVGFHLFRVKIVVFHGNVIAVVMRADGNFGRTADVSGDHTDADHVHNIDDVG